MYGWLETHQKRRGRVGDPDVLEFVDNITCWRAGRGTCNLYHSSKGLPQKDLCSNTQALAREGGHWRPFTVRGKELTVTALIPRRTQLVLGFRCCERIQQGTWAGTFDLESACLSEELCVPCALSEDVGRHHAGCLRNTPLLQVGLSVIYQ